MKQTFDKYDILETEDWDKENKVLIGPGGFECYLQEPEDARWNRDGQPAWKRMQKQHDLLMRVLKETHSDPITLISDGLLKDIQAITAPHEHEEE